MKMIGACLVGFGILAGCGSSGGGGGGGGASTEPANPCATKGASYLETLTEQSGGTCGAVPSQVVNISSTGTITTSTPITCAQVSQNGCTAQDSDCTFTSNGDNFTETFEVTFKSDGSSGSGIVSISGSGGGQSCASTYNVTFARQ